MVRYALCVIDGVTGACLRFACVCKQVICKNRSKQGGWVARV